MLGLLKTLVTEESAFGRFHSARLSSMSRYGDLLPDFLLRDIAAPVLFIQCEQSFFTGPDGGAPESDDWRAAAWDPSFTVRPVPANHFTIVEDAAEMTAQVIGEWLDTLNETD